MLLPPRRTGVTLLVVLAAGAVIGLGADRRAEASDRGLERIESDLAETREERGAVQERIDAATRAYEGFVDRIAQLEVDQEELGEEVEQLTAELADLDEVVTDRLRAVFKHGSNIDPLTVFLSSDDPQVALSRAETVQRAVASDRGRSEDLVAAQDRLDAAQQRLEERQQELDEARAGQAEAREELQASYEALGTRVSDLEEERREEQARIEEERRERERQRQLEEERRQAAAEAREERQQRQAGSGGDSTASTTSAPAPTSGSGMACPLDQPRSFIDSWGHARSGGRAHRGTDLMGPRGIPVRAITDGVWDIQRAGPSAGLWAILRASNGDQFWYLHLDSHTVSDGARVSAGQQVGTNGSTGNAVAGAEHVHFEHHPGGGRAINPYPLLRSVCG